MMSVWINNSKNICLRMIVNMKSLIRENTGKYLVKENGQTESIMFGIIMMLHTKMWKFIVIPTNSQHYHFVVHIQSLVEKGIWVSIIIYVLIQIYVIAYVKFAVYHVPVLDVHQWLAKPGFLVFIKQNRHTTNLSPTVLIGQFWYHITILISSI